MEETKIIYLNDKKFAVVEELEYKGKKYMNSLNFSPKSTSPTIRP